MRVLGIQEPASVVFSVLNSLYHLRIFTYRAAVPSSTPMYYVWHIVAAVSVSSSGQTRATVHYQIKISSIHLIHNYVIKSLNFNILSISSFWITSICDTGYPGVWESVNISGLNCSVVKALAQYARLALGSSPGWDLTFHRPRILFISILQYCPVDFFIIFFIVSFSNFVKSKQISQKLWSAV